MALTDAALKSYYGKKRDKVEEVADRDSFGIRVSALGKVTYQLRYRYNGKLARVDIGSYPLMSLKDARMEAQRLRAELEQGHDPRVVKQVEKQAIIEAVNIEQLFDLWYESYCIRNKKNHIEIKRTFKLYVFPKIGHLPADKVTLHEWLVILENKAKESPSIADRILTNGKQMLKWGVKRKIIPINVLSEITASEDLNVTKNTSDRVLTNDEIKWLWVALHQSRIAHKNRLFLILCLIYGCRNGEMRLAEKKHFDFDKRVWTVPPQNHKMGKSTKKPLIRPITDDTEIFIKEAMALNTSKFLFSNAHNDELMGHNAPVSLPYNIMQWLRKNKAYEMEHWSVHDLRRTARTNFSTLAQPHIAEIMLGHKLPGDWQTYDLYEYLDEQAEALTKWWARLMQLVN